MGIDVPPDLPGLPRPAAFPPIPPPPPQTSTMLAVQRYVTNIYHYFRKPLTEDDVMAALVSCLEGMDDDALWAWLEVLLDEKLK